jgi:septum formation topological specificity factor MinE
MRDPMHQVDLGAIVHLIRAILRKFLECVETALAKPGLAARKLRKRLELMLAKRRTYGNQL